MGYSKAEYNAIPVYYCKHCLSLKIRNDAGLSDLDYCDDCGSTAVETTTIDNWENLYMRKNGHRYLDSNY